MVALAPPVGEAVRHIVELFRRYRDGKERRVRVIGWYRDPDDAEKARKYWAAYYPKHSVRRRTDQEPRCA